MAGPAVAELDYSVRTGVPALDHARGVSWWDYFAADPEAAAIHDQMFVDQSNAIAPLLLQSCDLDGVHTVVDLGGGLWRPQHAAVDELPVDARRDRRSAVHRVGRARSNPRCGGAGSVRVRRRQLLDFVPSGDLCLLKHVPRDWPDDDAARLLSGCADAATAGGRVIVVDWLIGPPNEPDPAKLADLFVMLVLRGGRDRTEAEFRSLLDAANAGLDRITPLRHRPIPCSRPASATASQDPISPAHIPVGLDAIGTIAHYEAPGVKGFDQPARAVFGEDLAVG